MNSMINKTLFAVLGLSCAAVVHAQTRLNTLPSPVVTPGVPVVAEVEPLMSAAGLTTMGAAPVVKQLQLAAQARRLASGIPDTAAAALPQLKMWPYTFTSPRDGNVYSGTIVGSDPRLNGARTTTIPVVIIPLRLALTGTVRTFDPTQPDVGCLNVGGTNAMALTQASPIFVPVPNYTFNGANMGNVTFIDGFQRAQFWQDSIGGPMVNAKPAFHTALSYTVAPVQTITTANNSAGNAASFSFTGDCGTNASSAVNPPRYAFADINWIDGQLNNIIASLGIPQTTFALFITYRTYMTNGAPGTLSGNCCILGYHSSDFAVPTAPGHTYGIAGYDTGVLFTNTKDISTLSHEVLEWMNDPSGNNLVPEWGNIGQVGGCTAVGTGQNNLETGDPLSGTLMPGVLMTNGKTYNAQENAFFSWFLGTGFSGSGGKFSSNGTFSGFAKPCPPGGTN